ncbi:CobW family GTP-binding protein [Paenibacillus sp. CAU 1782]
MTNTSNSSNINRDELTPVYLLAGFLGSGKTTLLLSLLERLKAQGKKPAVIMNELGDVNLERRLFDEELPMAELLGGCICCSSRGDLGLEIHGLMERDRPDVILIEATGAANPMESIDGITEASMYGKTQLQGIITVVDGALLLDRGKNGKGKTYRLLQEGVRCATLLVLGKADKLAPEEKVEALQLLREWNAYAQIVSSVRGQLEDWTPFEVMEEGGAATLHHESHSKAYERHEAGNRLAEHREEKHQAHDDVTASGTAGEAHSPFKMIPSGAGQSHDHVMAVTYYFEGAVDSEAFENLLLTLPDNIYRAKGIVAFSDTSSDSRFMFQYAYKETDFMRIDPQGEVHNVAVFIGEHFSRQELLKRLEQLEEQG